MKKFLSLATVALLAFGASAQTAKEDVRIYINPGHGSWGPNNRHLATVGHNPISSENPDTTDFYESNTNLRKGLAMLEKLAEYGVPFDRTKNQTNDNPNRIGAALDLSQNIVMSHVKCGPYPYSNVKDETLGYIPDDQQNDFNRTLSTIAAEVDANNFDMFVSIHSNATTNDGVASTNYLYFAYDNKYRVGGGAASAENAEADAAHVATSIEMSRCGWNHRILDRHTKWSHYDYTMTAADVAAGKGKIGFQNLGVLNHTVPGYLVEGYFHSYHPARHRAMNFDVCRLEGVDYARGVADFFGWEKESYGAIYGVVRDKYNKFADDFYKPRSGTSDIYKPINGAIVTLKQGENVIAIDTTDVNYNGAFVFPKVEPGDYTVEFSHPDYNSDIYANTNATTEPAPLAITVKAAVTSYPEAFLIDKNWVAPSVVYVNYPDSLAGKDGFALAEEINIKGSELNGMAEQLADKTVRRTVLHEGLLYVLAIDAEKNPTLVVLDTDDNSVKATVSTAGCEGTHLNLSDIQVTADGYLIGCSKEWNQYSNTEVYTTGDANHTKYGYGDVRGECWIYKWEKDENGIPTGEPVKWISTQGTGNWFRAIVGETFAYSGTSQEGMAILSAQTATATAIRTQLVTVTTDAEGKVVTSESYHQPFLDGAAASIENTSLGETYNYVTSPLNDKNYYVVSAGNAPIYECEFTHTDKTNQISKLSTDIVPANVPNVNFFKYAGKSLMVAPEINADNKVEKVRLIDITDGFAATKEIVLQGNEIEPAEYSYASAHGELDLTIDEVSGITTKAEIELFLVVDGKANKYTTKGVKQPVYSGVYAYDLNVANEEGVAKVSFKLNNKSTNVDLVLTPVEGSEATEEVVYNLGALNAGENTYDVDINELQGDYNWSVVVANKTIATGEILTTMNTWGAGTTYYRGGIAVENNPESDNFATTYLGVGRSKGIFLMDPMYQVKEGAPYWVGQFNTGNASSTFRGALYNDKFYLTDWSDAYPGIWIFDPANPTAINNIFAGATNDGTGKLTIDGVAVGGGSTGVAFTGSGDDRKMFIYVEDLPTGNKGNKIYRYDIGAEDTWGAKEPVQFATPSAKLVNTNTGMLGSALHNVVFCSQTRNAGQNIASVPAFLIINEDGEEIFNGADLAETLTGCLGGGMALNADETKFAIVDGSAAIQVYDVEWTNDVPSFTHATTIPTKDQEICQMAFDYAGNLHCINRKHGYYVHAVPNVARDVETPAKAALVIKGNASGVENVTIEAVDEDAPVEYYNLQGVKVENPSNGIFIKVQGKKSEKVYIK